MEDVFFYTPVVSKRSRPEQDQLNNLPSMPKLSKQIIITGMDGHF